jgi:hypothetical protein
LEDPGLLGLGSFDSFALASSGVTMNTGVLEVSALFKRSRCASVRTCSGFCSTPLAATTWSSGHGDLHAVVAELERELARAEELLVLPAVDVGVGRHAREPLRDLVDDVPVLLEALVAGAAADLLRHC